VSRPGKYLISALFLLPLFTVNAEGASVKPLEIFSEKILQREIEHLADEHIISSFTLRRAVGHMNGEMNIMSKETVLESQKILQGGSDALASSIKSTEALSNYIASNSSRLKASGHGRFLPLARLNSEIEAPYHKALEKFLAIAVLFVGYCSDNFDAISTGSKDETKRYDELYASYIKEMDNFNDQSIKRSQLLGDWGGEYPELWELMPR
jgi:hypothetical protein